MTIFYINPVNLIQTLTMALDLAVDGIGLHQKRTAIICGHLSERLNLKHADEQVLLSAALLHDIGAASSSDERRNIQLAVPEWKKGEAIFDHSEKGYNLLKDSDNFASVSQAIRYHHDNWEGGNPSGLSGAAIPLNARVIHLADRIEINLKKNIPMLLNRESVQNIIKLGAGRQFDPYLIEIFMECSQVESFWLDLALPEHATSFNARMCMSTYLFTIDDMLRVAEIFATIIDRMSRFTATHSRSVSGVAVFLAKCLGFSNYELSLMRIAGLLHDLGKLSIPNDILEKSGPLTKEEQLIVRQHTFFTYRVLERIEKLENVAQWAAFHHETLDGLGYPFRRDENNMSLGSCVMCVADIFVALAENRPYRRKLPQDTITSIMRSMVENNKISSRLVELLFDHYRDVELIMVAMESFKEKSSLLEPHSNIA